MDELWIQYAQVFVGARNEACVQEPSVLPFQSFSLVSDLCRQANHDKNHLNDELGSDVER